MAGDWIKMRCNLWDDPRVAKICDLTDQPEATVIGGLYWLWATADQHTEDGIMPGLTLRSIDRKTGVQGLAEALVQVGWLADHPEGVRIVNFEDHNGASAKKRCQTAKRVHNHRSGNDAVTHEALQDGDASVSGALTREEKRREESSTTVEHGEERGSPPIPTCPHQDIIALWAEKLPAAVQPREWTPARSTALKARWREKKNRQSLDWWARLFGYISESDFLMGRVNTPGRRPFELSMDWLLKQENFVRVLEGRYHSKQEVTA